jgi:hypothetical protein
MKMRNLVDYAQTQRNNWLVLIGLQSSYVQAHDLYDQTHTPYAQAHVPRFLGVSRKQLNPRHLISALQNDGACIWNGSMVWLYITVGHVYNPVWSGLGWFGVCLPIKIAAAYGLHRKSLEQDARLMLQKQRIDFVF